MEERASIVREQNHYPVLRAFGDEVQIHLSGDDTGGNLTMFTSTTPPGGGPPPHYHEHEDEWFFPLDGPFEFFKDGQWIPLVPGSAVFSPKGTIHAFRNAGTAPARMLIHTSPSGFETFFEKCSKVFASPDGPNMAQILEIGIEHGIHFVANDDN